MSQIRKRAVLWAPLLLVLLAIVAAAEVVQENYRRVQRYGGGAAQPHRSNVSGTGDAKTAPTDLSAADVQPTSGDPTILASPRFTVAGATVTVSCWLYDDNGQGTYTLMDIADVQTATASTVFRESASGDYMVTDPLFFDAGAADAYVLLYHDVSSGQVEPWARTLGAASALAE